MGQAALGISFLSPSNPQMIGLALIQVLLHLKKPFWSSLILNKRAWKTELKIQFQEGFYLADRTSLPGSAANSRRWISSWCPTPCSFLQVPTKIFLFTSLKSRWAGHAASFIQLLNGLLFLCHGRHASVSKHLLTFVNVNQLVEIWSVWFMFGWHHLHHLEQGFLPSSGFDPGCNL